jgi:Fibronectin type III domain
MPDGPGRPARLRPWASTRELTVPPDRSGPGSGTGSGAATMTTRRGWRGLTGYGCIALTVAIVIAGAAFGASPHRVLAAVHGVTAWLANDSQGSVTQANGLSGRADARIKLADAAGHKLKVIQDGSTILIQDLTTRTVTRIDPADLTITQTAGLSAAGAQIVAGAGLAFLIDPHAGTVVQINPVSLTIDGPPVTLTAPLGANPGITSDGTLWVPDDGTGDLVPVRHGAAATPVPVGQRGDVLTLTIAGGRPAVADSTADTLTVLATGQPTTLASASARTTINLPPAGGGAILAPPSTPGSIVPLLLDGQRQLVVVNVARNTVSAVPLTGRSRDRLDAPLALGTRVYIPDESQGALVSYDTASQRLGSQIAIGSGPGPIDAFVQDGELWANSPDGSRAVCVNSDGTSYSIDKYQPNLPGGPLPGRPRPSSSPSPRSGPGGPGGPGVPSPGGPGTPSQGGVPGPGPTTGGPPTGPSSPPPPPHPRRSPSPNPTPTSTPPPPPPTAPGVVTESAQPGSIGVTFSPVSSGTPLRYVLHGAPGAATVTPARVTATGPFQFTVTGLSCAQSYGFAVTAVFANGQATSAPAAAVRPCLSPGAPGNLTATPADQAINVSWSAAAGNGGTVTYTVTWSGAASGSQPGVSGTSFAITGLANRQSYTVTVTAVSPAGQTMATATATLTPPAPVPEHIYNNSRDPVNMRTAPYLPGGSNPCSNCITSFAPNSNAPVTVLCQTTGSPYTDPSGSPSGDIWDEVTDASGQTGYVADGYVTTPESVAGNYSSFSTPTIWHC